jgi:hypothetical protein
VRAEDQPTEAAEKLLAILQEALALMRVHPGGFTDPVKGGNIPADKSKTNPKAGG